MKSKKDALLIITNLYPLPWEPNRATFNRQQFALLENEFDTSFIIPVAFIEWFKHRKSIKQTDNIRYCPYFFTPKIGRRFYSKFMFISLMLHSFGWAKRKSPKKVLASWAFPDAVAAQKFSKRLKAQFYFKVHGSDIDIQCQHPERANQVVNASTFARGILSVSQALAKKMVDFGVSEQKIKVIYNGVNHERFSKAHPRPIDKPYFLFIGNLKPDKGVMELLEGFAQFGTSHQDYQLVFAGNGPMKAVLTARAKELGLSEQVSLLGGINHSEVSQWLQHATALCLPSYHEGVPNVVLEAMASGVPVIASNVGGIPEVVNESTCGKLIAIKSADAVYLAMNHIIAQDWSKADIQEHAQQFSWEKNQQQLIELLSQ